LANSKSEREAVTLEIKSQRLLAMAEHKFKIGQVVYFHPKKSRLPSYVLEICDFSLQSVRSRAAKVGDKLVTRDFGTGTRGFAAVGDLGLAVCVMPGTELAFAGEVACLPTGLFGWKTKAISYETAIFRQVNKDKSAAHHDALEFPDGRTVLLTHLCEGQAATVLQLPAQPATAAEVDAQKRVTYVG
jgi:hypothetical protein